MTALEALRLNPCLDRIINDIDFFIKNEATNGNFKVKLTCVTNSKNLTCEITYQESELVKRRLSCKSEYLCAVLDYYLNSGFKISEELTSQVVSVENTKIITIRWW